MKAVSNRPFVDLVLRGDLARLHASLVVRDDSDVCGLAEALRAPGRRGGQFWPQDALRGRLSPQPLEVGRLSLPIAVGLQEAHHEVFELP